MDFNKFKDFVSKHKILSTISGLFVLLVLGLLTLIVFISISSTLGLSSGNFSRTSEFGKGLVAPTSYYADYDMVASESYSAQGSNTSVTSQSNTDNRKVIQNGNLDIYVGNTDTAVVKVKEIAERYSGYFETSNIREVTSGTKSGQITIRVPAQQFNTAMDEIKKVAEKVNSENVNTTDVTAKYVDLTANLKNYKAEEEQYLEIMKKAVTIEEILRVQQKLFEVRGRIEVTQGQLNQLNRQSDMSTITVKITSEPDVKILGVTWKPLNTIRIEFRNFVLDMKGIFEMLVSFLFALPGLILRIVFVVIIFIAIIVALVKTIKFTYRKFLKNKEQVQN